jgi:hypothetical protein
VVIADAFPTPPAVVGEAFAQLAVARFGDEEQREELGPLEHLPRPWDPATCPPTLRREVWVWLDDVAAWINGGYSWQPDRTIPACWPAHPHIAHELAVVASVRLAANEALTADVLESWHRYALPTFLDRMAARLGSGCQPGRHPDWPGGARYHEFIADQAVDRRAELFAGDVGPDCWAAGVSTTPARPRLTVVDPGSRGRGPT